MIARRLGVDTIVVRNDLEHERYRLARPGHALDRSHRSAGRAGFAGPVVDDDTVIPLIDERTLANRDAAESFPVVAAWNLRPSAVVEAASADDPLILVGSGDGIVDAAAARLLDPERPVLYASTLDDLTETGDFDPAMVGPNTWWLVTDTNRKQARHWSTVSSNLGALEAAGPLTLDDDPADQQLDVFLRPPDHLDRQTHAVHRADVSDVRRELLRQQDRVHHRRCARRFAFDGDPTTRGAPARSARRAGSSGRSTSASR